MALMRKLLVDVRPEFRGELRQTGSHDAQADMDERRVRASAGGWVVSVGESGAHSGTEHVRPIEACSAGIRPGNQCAADGVGRAVDDAVAGAETEIARIFVKRRSEHEISKQILRCDIGEGCAHRLCEAGGFLPYFGSVSVR